MDDKVKKNTSQIHKEATEWAKKIDIVYVNLLNRSDNYDRKTIVDAIRFYGPNFQRLPECVESSIILMKCFLMSSGDNNEGWDMHQKNAFNVFASAMISQKKEDYIVRQVLGCWSTFLTKLPEDECEKLIYVQKSSKIIKMLFNKLGQARTYFTQMRLVEILHIYSKHLPDGGFKLMEDVKLNGSQQLYEQLHVLFLQINIDDFVDTCRRFLNFYNTYLGKKNGIVSMLGRLRILNHQSFSKSDIHSDFLDFNGKCLSMSFFIPKKFLTKNVITTELMYVELEDFEIDAMEFDDFTDPNEKNIQLSIQPIKYFILDSNGKTVLNIPDLEKLVIEINDESSIKKNFSEKVYSHYKNRTKNQDDATTNRDDESIMSFATYNTDFCNSPMIEQVKNRNLSIKPSFQEIEPSSTLNQNKIMNVYNRSQQMDLSKSTSDVFLPLSQKQPKQSEDLYSSIDYGRRHENAAFQIEKVVQKVRPMQEIPPKRCNIQIERIQTTNTSVPVVQNKRVVKNPRTKRIEALRQDVYDAIDDGGVSPVIPYQSFISQEREKRKRLLQNKNFDEIIPDSEDFTLEDNFDTDEKLIPTVAKKSKNKKVPVKKVTQVKSSTKAAPKRAMQTRSKKETAPKKLKTAKENITPPKISLKPAAKTKKQPKNHREPPIMMNESKTIEKTTRRVIFSSSSSEDHFKPLQNHADNDDESDMDMDVVIHPKAPIVAIEQLMAAKKKREEMMKMQKIEKMKNSMYPYFPVIKPLKDHSVEIVKKTTKQKPRTARKAKYISSSENNFEPLQNHADNDDESDMDMDVVIHPKAPIEAIESLITSKKHRVELNKTQEVEKMKKTKKPNFPVLKPLINHPVEIVKQATEQKPRDTEYNHKCLGDKIEKIDSVHIVRNVTFTTRVSPGSSQLIQNNQDCVQRAKKRINKRMDDVDEIIQYHDMEVDNPQVQNNVQRTRVVSTDKRDLSLEYDNEHYKRMKPSISSNTQNITYDPPINYNFDQLRSNKLLNKFISQTNNNETDQQHYKESVTVQRTTTIQQRVSIDQSPSKETQIINRTNFKVANRSVIPSKLREHYKTRASVASAEARKKIMSMRDGIDDQIDKSLRESFCEGFAKIGNLNKDMKIHCSQYIQLMKKIHHSKRRIIEFEVRSREVISDMSEKLKDSMLQLKESSKYENKLISKIGLELKQKEQECKSRAWQCFMDEFLNSVQEETIKHYEF